MINIKYKGLFVDENILLNYKQYSLIEEEIIFLLQLNYLTEQGSKSFLVKNVAKLIGESENNIFLKLDSLIKKKIISITSDNKIIFNIFNNKDKYYTLKELYKFVELVTSKVLTSNEMNIINSWITKGFTKEEINEALSISKNINYANGVLNNKYSSSSEKVTNSNTDDDWINYEWL